MNILQTFAVANGWTLNIYSSGDSWMAMNNGSVYVQFRWDSTGLLAIFHSLGFISTGTAPGNHTNDSGLGIVDASAPYSAALATSTTNSRVMFLPNGASVSYNLFCNGSSYIYMVVQTAAGVYYHMGIGTIDKRGDWTGGEFAYGDFNTTASNPISVTGTAFQNRSTSTTGINTQFSLHVEGLPGQDAAGKWAIGLTTNTTSGSNPAGNDRAGNPRMVAWAAAYSSGLNLGFSRLRHSLTNGLLPLLPMEVWYKNSVSSSIHRMYLLGHMPEVYTMNMGSFSAEQEVTIGANTYKIFPARQKGVSHGHMAVVYRKIV